MAKDTKVAVVSRNLAIDAELARLDAGGKCRIYSGAKPADADTAIGAQVLLAEIALNADAFAAAAAGSASANATTPDASADATGTAAWARFVTSGGAACFDCTVGGSAQGDTLGTHDILLNTTAIVAGAQVSLTAFTFSRPA